jgi:6-pyruvoyl-tetrahydropterin synthase
VYAVTVRDHVMVAHSLTGEVFGPAQALHGATFTVDATFRGPRLDGHGILVDIGLVTEVLRAVLDPLRYRNLDNLDEVPELAGRNTTTEVLAGFVAGRLVDEVRSGALVEAREHVTGVIVTLHESHVAWASCELPVDEADRREGA